MKRKNNFLIIMGIIAVMVLIVGAASVLYFYNKKTDQPKGQLLPEQPRVAEENTPNTGPEIPEPGI